MGEQNMVHVFGMRMSRRVWANARWDFASALTFSLFNVVFNQFYIPIAIRHGATDFQVGLLSAAPAIGLLLSPIWAGIAERGRARTFVVFPNAIARLLIIIPALFASPWVFVAAALGFHLMAGVAAPPYATLMTQIYPSEIRGRLMGYARVVMGIMMIPLAYLAGIWIDSAGHFYPLISGALIGSMSILLLLMLQDEQGKEIREPAQRKRISFREQLQVLKNNSPLLLFLSSVMLAGFGNMLASPLYNIIQVEHLNLSNTEIGYIRTAYFSCLLVAYLLAGWVIDRFSPKLALTVGLCCNMTVTILYGLFGTFSAAIVGSGLQGIADATWDLSCMAYVFRLAPGKEGVVFGIHLMLFGIRGTIGPLLSTGLNGVLPIEAILFTATGLCLIGILMLILNKGKGQSSDTSVLPA